ncbi:MAG: Cobalt-containing nitrile hydratase subunit alpha [Alphaproteobacteria bacterium MarineAlpha11_Bin1]|nr:MAG: Cobalt-containing nitrile hydratase subunit alpha [Alphaproteobacteria bacterium MarineAlpha11_Bin1]
MNNDDRTAHDHTHEHDHPGTTPDINETGYYELMAEAMKELLIEKGVVSADDVRRNLEFLDSRDPVDGGRVIAKAWTDPDFRKRLLSNGTTAVQELGLTMGDAELVVVENTDDVHNMIVCTLCSCYPRTLLGLPPDWYKSKSYRSRAVVEPRLVLKEFGTHVPEEKTVRVHDSNADMRYLVLPQQPEGTEGWSEENLARIVSRDAMVGVVLPRV